MTQLNDTVHSAHAQEDEPRDPGTYLYARYLVVKAYTVLYSEYFILVYLSMCASWLAIVKFTLHYELHHVYAYVIGKMRCMIINDTRHNDINHYTYR